jgi:hypothetical protein
MTNGTKAAIGADHGVQAAKLVQFTGLDEAPPGDATGCSPVEHQDDGAVMVVVFATEVEE